MPLSFTLDDAQKAFLGRQARRAIESALAGDETAQPLDATPVNVHECAQALDESALEKDLGSFVTLTINHNLRGCIGTIVGHEPLWLNVWNMARAAAFNDPRFPPLRREEWQKAAMEISVLDQPAPCPDPSQIVIGRDGLILQYRGRGGVFLPQVPVEQGWNLEQYLENLCRKAGLPAGSWKQPGAALFWYQALVFPGSAPGM